MALRHAVLTALLEGEASGYELAKTFDVSVANFWHALPPQLYTELGRLEAAGLVTGREVPQRGRPSKRVYAVTDEGIGELAAFAAAGARPSAMKDELLVQVAAADVLDAETVVARLEERGEQAAAKLALYEKLQARLLDGRDEAAFLAAAERIGPYLTLARGISYERENAAWCAWAAERLRARVRA